ncbi:hypothetical protein [Patiriisocius marinus]|uniref:hypothetical protein n=1 Tax=Patiriisocius marinus TaxID=1397112 RepID=UPI0023307611|nr:hypothetical protein [Patiriisocius marinus]
MRHRKKFITWLFKWTMVVYCKFKKKEAWNISTAALLEMKKHTFGYKLGALLHKNGFELIPKVERHDAYHLLTGFGTTVEEEIALQYCCYGNGKRTPYLYGVLLIGTLILPEYFPFYMKAYRYGKNANDFHHFDFKQILKLDFKSFQDTIFTSSAQLKMDYHQRKKHIAI